MSDQDEDAFDHMHRAMASQGGHLFVVGEVIKERDAALAEVERLRDAYGQGWEDGGNAALADFHEDNPDAIKRCRELLDRAEAAEIERLRGRLLMLEWAGGHGDAMWCPVCGGSPQVGDHGPNCWLAAELRSTREEEMEVRSKPPQLSGGPVGDLAPDVKKRRPPGEG